MILQECCKILARSCKINLRIRLGFRIKVMFNKVSRLLFITFTLRYEETNHNEEVDEDAQEPNCSTRATFELRQPVKKQHSIMSYNLNKI